MTRIPAAFETGTLHGKGYLKSVSPQGLFLRTDTLPETGDPVSVAFLDGRRRKIEVYGTVRWTTTELDLAKEARPGFGMEIDHPSPEYREFWAQLLLTG